MVVGVGAHTRGLSDRRVDGSSPDCVRPAGNGTPDGKFRPRGIRGRPTPESFVELAHASTPGEDVSDTPDIVRLLANRLVAALDGRPLRPTLDQLAWCGAANWVRLKPDAAARGSRPIDTPSSLRATSSRM